MSPRAFRSSWKRATRAKYRNVRISTDHLPDTVRAMRMFSRARSLFVVAATPLRSITSRENSKERSEKSRKREARAGLISTRASPFGPVRTLAFRGLRSFFPLDACESLRSMSLFRGRKEDPSTDGQSLRTEELFHSLPIGNILTPAPLFNSLSDAPCRRRMECVLVLSIVLASVDRAATFESVDLSVPVG